jgi:hypothetical protein
MMQAIFVEMLSTVLLAQTLDRLNHMSRSTQFGIRLATVLIATGAFIYFLGPWCFEVEYTVKDYLILSGTALYLAYDRRTNPL